MADMTQRGPTVAPGPPRAPFAAAVTRARRSGILPPCAVLTAAIVVLLPHLASTADRFDGADLVVTMLVAWLIACIARAGRRDG